MAKEPTLEERRIAVDAYVRHRLEEERQRYADERGSDHGFQTQIAKRTHVEAPTVNFILKGSRGVGEKFAFGIAQARGLTEEQLRAQAIAWWRSNGEPTSGPVRAARAETRTIEPDHGMADALIADMIAAGVMTEAERASVRPRLIRELGASSTGTLDATQQRAAARRALDEAHESIAAFRGAREVATEAPDLSKLQPKKRGKK